MRVPDAPTETLPPRVAAPPVSVEPRPTTRTKMMEYSPLWGAFTGVTPDGIEIGVSSSVFARMFTDMIEDAERNLQVTSLSALLYPDYWMPLVDNVEGVFTVAIVEEARTGTSLFSALKPSGHALCVRGAYTFDVEKRGESYQLTVCEEREDFEQPTLLKRMTCPSLALLYANLQRYSRDYLLEKGAFPYGHGWTNV